MLGQPERNGTLRPTCLLRRGEPSELKAPCNTMYISLVGFHAENQRRQRCCRWLVPQEPQRPGSPHFIDRGDVVFPLRTGTLRLRVWERNAPEGVEWGEFRSSIVC